MAAVTKQYSLTPGLTSDFTAVAVAEGSHEPSATAVLTGRLARGEDDAFREFHALYFDRLYQFLLVVARGQEHEAREALQETLLRVTRHARQIESEEIFWCWLKMVARSAAKDAGRKNRRYMNLLQRFAEWWRPSEIAETPDESNHLRPLLDESLAEMELSDRRLLEGKYLEGSTVRELSDATGLTEKAVESKLLRSRRQLRESLLKKLRSL